VFTGIGDGIGVHRSGALVPQPLRVARGGIHGAEDGLPDVELPARPSVVAHGKLEKVQLLDGGRGLL
jgi:hypothetical protein